MTQTSDDNGEQHLSKSKDDRIAELESMLRRAVKRFPEFDTNESVSGGDLVEWFAEWRHAANRLLEE